MPLKRLLPACGVLLWLFVAVATAAADSITYSPSAPKTGAANPVTFIPSD